jgi:hypothetical protein
MIRMLAGTVAILVVTAAIAGALYLGFGSRGPSFPADRPFRPGAPFGSEGFRRGHGGRNGEFPERGERRGREEASVGHGIAGVAGTALQVGLVGAVVVGLQKRSKRRRH